MIKGKVFVSLSGMKPLLLCTMQRQVIRIDTEAYLGPRRYASLTQPAITWTYDLN